MKHTFIFKSLLLAVLLCTAGVVDVQAKGTSVVEASVGGGSGSISPGSQSSNSSSPIDFTFYAYPSTGYHVSSWSAWKSTSSGCEPKYCTIVGAGGAYQNYAIVRIDWGSGYTVAGSGNRHHGYVRVWFEPNTYTIWSNANGGNWNGFGTVNPTYDSTNYYSWGGAGRTGYTFLGWWDHPTGGTQVYGANGVCVNNTGYWSGNCWKHDGNVTIYAHWQANNYTVTFNTNGGSCSYQNLGVTYDATTNSNVSSQNPTRTGYTFQGWYTAANGGTQVYNANGACVAGDYFNASSQWKYTNNLTVYAHWTPNVYTVNFDKNADDASISSLSKQVTYDATYGTLPTTERNQYSFAGWFTGKEDGTKVESTTTVKITDTQTLYGHWSKRVNESVTTTGVKIVEFTNHGTTTNQDIQEDMDDSQVPDGVVVVDLTKVENMDNPDDIVNVVRNHSKSTPNTFIIVNDDLKDNISDDNKENVLFKTVTTEGGQETVTYSCANFSAVDGVNLSVPYPFTADAATYVRNNSSRWGTICVPFELKSDDRIQYYTSGTKYGTSLVLTEAATVAAGTPAIYCVSSIDVSGENGTTKNKENLNITHYDRSVLQAAGVSGDPETIKLVGTFTELKIDDTKAAEINTDCDIYYYQDNTFYKRSSGQTVTIPALRAYILIKK